VMAKSTKPGKTEEGKTECCRENPIREKSHIPEFVLFPEFPEFVLFGSAFKTKIKNFGSLEMTNLTELFNGEALIR